MNIRKPPDMNKIRIILNCGEIIEVNTSSTFSDIMLAIRSGEAFLRSDVSAIRCSEIAAVFDLNKTQ
ncbi:hypothetical protein LJK87_49990 [Paenibacillus sp. P25]|nr:hypothetical protein LJK87_49990 [Paenibacillus sp. P25]